MRKYWLDLLAVVVLFAVALVFMGFLLRDDLFIYGDNPAQFLRLWQGMDYSWHLRGRIVDWAPFWYAGYPELQFYPPGFAILGWALKGISFGVLSDFLIYQILVFSAFAWPGFAIYYALARLGFGRIAAVSGGLFGMIFPGVFDGSLAPLIGLVGSRLAFGFSALVFTWGVLFIEHGGWLRGLRAALVLALTILMHPFHSVGALLGVGIFWLIALRTARDARKAFLRLIALPFSALALTAFWVMPLLAHSSEAIPIVRATFDAIVHELASTQYLPYLALAVVAVARLTYERQMRLRVIVVTLVMWLLMQTAMVVADYALLLDRLNIYALDPVRLTGEIYLTLVMLAGIGAGSVIERVYRWLRGPTLSAKRRRMGALASLGVAVLIVAVALWPFPAMAASFRERAGEEPIWLSEVAPAYRLNELWRELRAQPGRVLFTSNYSTLHKFSTRNLPTTLLALTPYFTQREMMGGTFSSWSAVAALMWVGRTHPPALFGRVEENDDRSLFGVEWAQMNPEKFAALCRAFDVTTIVASVDDFHARTFLDRVPYFQSYWNDDWYFLYRVKDYQPSVVEARNAQATLMQQTPTRLRVRITQATSQATLTLKMAYYPLWTACTADASCLPVRSDELGRLTIDLREGESDLTIEYRDDAAQTLGMWISIIATAIWLMLMGWAVWHHKPGESIRGYT